MTIERSAAEEYSESIGQIGSGWWRQIAWAEQQGIRKALELSTREWVARYVGGHVRLSISDRREAVAELTSEGMSGPEVAGVLGVSDETVYRDLGNRSTDVEMDVSPPEEASTDVESPTRDKVVERQDHRTAERGPGSELSETPPILHEAVQGIDPGEKGFVSLIRGVIRDLEEAELINAGVVTPGKAAVMRDLFDEVQKLFDEWEPHLFTPLKEVK